MSRQGSPEVSVVIPVWNGEATVGRAIDSVLAQRFDGTVEVIVVNDGSTDGTASVLAGYGGAIRMVEQENRGLAGARNSGVRASTAEYIAFLDDDDIWMPHKLASTVPLLRSDPECAMVYSNALVVDERGELINRSYTPADQGRAPLMSDLLSGLWNILPSSAVIPRSLFERCGGFCEDFRGYGCEDAYFYLLAREQGRFRYLPEPLLTYRHSAVSENLRKRAEWAGCNSADDFGELLAKVTRNYDRLVELVDARYRRSARGMIGQIRKAEINLLVGLGLRLMSHGDRIRARQSYVKALAYGPLHPETIARFSWTLLPDAVAAPLSTILPRRFSRALAGAEP